MLPVLASIPAIVLGHLAIGQIRRSNGMIGGKGMAIAGLVLGYLTIVLGLLAAMGFAAGQTAIKKARQLQARADCINTAQAVEAYFDEYHSLPSSLNGDVEISTNSAEGTALLSVLLGEDTKRGAEENPKRIRFVQIREARGKRGGLAYSATGKVTALYDPWGGPFHVVIDGDYDEEVRDPLSGSKVYGRRVLVYSPGPNGKNDGGGGDDVKSW